MEFHGAIDWKQVFQSRLRQSSPLKAPGEWNQVDLPFDSDAYGFTNSYLVCGNCHPARPTQFVFFFLPLDITSTVERFSAVVEVNVTGYSGIRILHLFDETFVAVCHGHFVVCRIAEDEQTTFEKRLEVLCVRRIFLGLFSIFEDSIAYMVEKNASVCEIKVDTFCGTGHDISTVSLCSDIPHLAGTSHLFQLTRTHLLWACERVCLHYRRDASAGTTGVTKGDCIGRHHLCQGDPDLTHGLTFGFTRARFFTENEENVMNNYDRNPRFYSGTRVDFVHMLDGEIDRISHLRVTPHLDIPFLSTTSLDCVVIVDCRFVYVYDVREHTLLRKTRHGMGRNMRVNCVASHRSRPLLVINFDRRVLVSSNNPELLQLITSHWERTDILMIETVILN